MAFSAWRKLKTFGISEPLRKIFFAPPAVFHHGIEATIGGIIQHWFVGVDKRIVKMILERPLSSRLEFLVPFFYLRIFFKLFSHEVFLNVFYHSRSPSPSRRCHFLYHPDEGSEGALRRILKAERTRVEPKRKAIDGDAEARPCSGNPQRVGGRKVIN